MEARKRVPDDPCLKDISHYVGVILRALIFQGMGRPASLQIEFFCIGCFVSLAACLVHAMPVVAC